VEPRFSTSLNPGNGLFSTGICNDQIARQQVRLIGDGLGDDQARVILVQGGVSTQRGCESGRGGAGDVLRGYELAQRRAEVQAGVNVLPTSAPDTQLAGRSVAASEWRLAIPPGDEAPANADRAPDETTRELGATASRLHRATTIRRHNCTTLRRYNPFSL
jgi:hypothetical protein